MSKVSPTTPSLVRILVVDDQPLFREGLRVLLMAHADLKVVGEAANGKEAIQQAASLQPDVVLMDLRMPVLDGIAATRRLRITHPNCRVIVLTTFDDDEDIFEGLRAGAVGYLLKDVASDQLADAIRAVVRGESLLQPNVAAKIVTQFNHLANQSPQGYQALTEPLSKRELEILRLVAGGASNKEIATMLVIAEGTVRNHLTNVFGKLGVRDRIQATLKAKALGLL